MLGQLNIYGKDRVETAIQRFRTFEPPDGYYLAFSGGKDSCVIKALADMAGVKYDAHYSVTTVDPPELVRFIKEKHPDVSFDRQYWPENYKNEKLRGKAITMWNLIPEAGMPPTRIARYCCAKLKESQGRGRFVVTGVRQAESTKRRNRAGLEVGEKGKRERYDVDNAEDKLTRTCSQKSERILNPIIDWSNDDVWEFIHTYNIPYCELYDEGETRLGCIGCPMTNLSTRLRRLERYPKYKDAYIRAFDRMIAHRGGETKSGEELYAKWTSCP